MNIEIIGFAAGVLVAFSLLPQVVKSICTRSTTDISIQWSVINLLGQILWLVYGVLIDSKALYIMSGITLVMALIVFVLKLRFGMNKNDAV